MKRLLLLVFFLVALAPPAAAQQWGRAPEAPIVYAAAPAVPNAWVSVPGGVWLTVHGPADRDDLLLRLARHGAEALPRLAERLEVPIGDTVHVYVSPTNDHFRELQPGTPPTWADATAYPGYGSVFLRDPKIRVATDEPLEKVLDHELVHILLGRAFAPNHPPAWLQEGVAQVLARQAGPETAQILGTATVQGDLMSLDSMARWFPKDAHGAHVAYAQSADFVQYLEVEYGTEVVARLVNAGLKGRTLSGAVRDATGEGLPDIEARWRDRWTISRGVTVGVMAHIGEIAFGATGLLLLVGGVFRRRRFHRRLQEMGEQEAMVDGLVAELRARRASTPVARTRARPR